MSKRERSIGIAVGAAMGILLLDAVVITPLFNERSSVEAKILSTQDDFNKARQLIRNSRNLDRELVELQVNGLKSDVNNAQNQMVNRLDEWGRMTGVEISNISPSGSPSAVLKIGGKGTEKEKGFQKLTCRVAIKGRMEQIARFVYMIQTSQIPLRVSDISVEPEKEGMDGLKITLGVVTVFLSPETGTAVNASGARGTAAPATRQVGSATRSSNPATAPTPQLQSQQAPTPPPFAVTQGGMSVEEQMRARRTQQSQPGAVPGPATAPTTSPEAR